MDTTDLTKYGITAETAFIAEAEYRGVIATLPDRAASIISAWSTIRFYQGLAEARARGETA